VYIFAWYLSRNPVEINRGAEDPLQLYREEFEVPLAAATSKYYLNESLMYIQELSISQFMETVALCN
jgi:hypothetical protein